MAEAKMQPTGASVDDFLDAIADPVRREDGKAMRAMMERLSGHEARMWGSSIIGFGQYRYRYESGHSGVWLKIGFSPRARELVLYLLAGFDSQESLLERLGPHRATKSCLYVKRLDRLDHEVLEQMIRKCLDFIREAYPEES